MAFCRKCGAAIDDEAIICPHCGVRQQAEVPLEPEHKINDSGSIGWAILAFFIPPVGFILWLAWMGVKPKCSRMAGYGLLALIGLCVALVLSGVVMGMLNKCL